MYRGRQNVGAFVLVRIIESPHEVFDLNKKDSRTMGPRCIDRSATPTYSILIGKFLILGGERI